MSGSAVAPPPSSGSPRAWRGAKGAGDAQAHGHTSPHNNAGAMSMSGVGPPMELLQLCDELHPPLSLPVLHPLENRPPPLRGTSLSRIPELQQYLRQCDDRNCFQMYYKVRRPGRSGGPQGRDPPQIQMLCSTPLGTPVAFPLVPIPLPAQTHADPQLLPQIPDGGSGAAAAQAVCVAGFGRAA